MSSREPEICRLAARGESAPLWARSDFRHGLLTNPAAALAHLALLFAPVWLWPGAGAALGDAVLWAFAALASLACLVESAAAAARPRPALSAAAAHSEAPGWLPYATGGALLLTFWAGIAGRGPEPGGVEPAAVLGGTVFAAGIWLRARAVDALGAGFTNKVRWAAGQRLVTGGIYARLRHPSEAGILCLGLGGALLLGSAAAAAAALVLLLPLVAWRIRLEDRMLAREHGEAYRSYAGAVPGLVPRLRRTSMAAPHVVPSAVTDAGGRAVATVERLSPGEATIEAQAEGLF